MAPRDPSLNYALEKAVAALETLAEHDGVLKDRLIDAWRSQLSNLEDEELPSPFKVQYFEMLDVIAEGDDDEQEGTLAVAIRRLTLEDARFLANRMVRFALDLETTVKAQN